MYGSSYGMIAGNGRFPLLALESAKRLGVNVVVIAIDEEVSADFPAQYRISLGALSRLIEICKSEGITELMMCGQVKHTKIFSAIRPDWCNRMASLGAADEIISMSSVGYRSYQRYSAVGKHGTPAVHRFTDVCPKPVGASAPAEKFFNCVSEICASSG